MSLISPIPVQASDKTIFQRDNQTSIGWWTTNDEDEPVKLTNLPDALRKLSKPLYILTEDGEYLLAQSGIAQFTSDQPTTDAIAIIAHAPAISAKQLGDASFCSDYGIRLPYMTGAMANGIASTSLVKTIARSGMLASYGAAGLTLNIVESALRELKQDLGDTPYCANLIHSPNEKGKEDATVDLFIKLGLKLVEASAYLALTPAVVRYRVHGIYKDDQGKIHTPNRIIAKASRIEVANRWFSPPPEKILQQLKGKGEITQEQMELARYIPMAQDLTMEADSGGHTDNRPAITLLPTIVAMRDRMQKEHAYLMPLRVGLAGGIATPTSAAATFAMGAAYIVTGTINQACVESGTSDLVRKMLTEAQQADVAMAPAVDMFEMGVKLQVLKRGTMFSMRANKLYEAYQSYNSVEEIPAKYQENIEKTIFRATFEQIWQDTKGFYQENDPSQITKAEQDPKHKMALMFRWYLGLSSRWANAGVVDRQADYQVWCGPAMGAFNEWTKDSFLEKTENRLASTVALNIMFGAAVTARINMIGNQGIELPALLTKVDPMAKEEIENYSL